MSEIISNGYNPYVIQTTILKRLKQQTNEAIQLILDGFPYDALNNLQTISTLLTKELKKRGY